MTLAQQFQEELSALIHKYLDMGADHRDLILKTSIMAITGPKPRKDLKP